MRTYQRVTELTEARQDFFARHRDRIISEHLPRGAWICEEDGVPLIGLLVFTEPNLRVSVIMDEPEKKQFNSLSKLAKKFEKWATEHEITHYGVVLDQNDDHYARIIEKRGAVEMARYGPWVEYLHQIDQTPNLEDGIREWQPSDWKMLRPLMRQFLEEHCRQGGDFLPSRNNIEQFIRRGVKGAGKGDPCLVAIEGGKVIGFCLWTGIPDTGLDLRENVCQGLGTFVLPEYRRQGWSTKLRAEGMNVAALAGYDRVDGVALANWTLAAGKAAGFKPAGVLVRQKVRQEKE